ncbi:hypothetical protein SDC9_120005 [bioreactor metagenome]|uniref:ABC transmembrane type-1 domain-containing protein n=1 Tax=bioreactor metagenome TaxID=1076179 RepID=A0A645C5V9_9ZZZZ|nr:carbohydrate ABC transporter permease [Oscillospiraceae bacterium]
MNNTDIKTAEKLKHSGKNLNINKNANANKKIKVDFEGKTSAGERFRLRVFSLYFLKNIVWVIFRLVLLLGISYVIILPFVTKIAGSIMSPDDFLDVTVKLISKYPTLDTYKYIITENKYLTALSNTAILSLLCAVVQMLTCAVVGYGFSKFKFRGNKFLFLCVVFTMIVPHQTLQLSMFMKFRYFDIYGIYSFIYKTFNLESFYTIGKDKFFRFDSVNLINTYWPLAILSFGGLAFKNGLYIFIMRQFYKGVPDELEEAAYVDGSGVIKTFVKIIIPLSIPMMVTVFLFAFSWQWSDNFYTSFFFTKEGLYLMPHIVSVPKTLEKASQLLPNAAAYQNAITSTCGLMIVFPLIILYCFCQNFLIQGIERSGIVG